MCELKKQLNWLAETFARKNFNYKNLQNRHSRVGGNPVRFQFNQANAAYQVNSDNAKIWF